MSWERCEMTCLTAWVLSFYSVSCIAPMQLTSVDGTNCLREPRIRSIFSFKPPHIRLQLSDPY